ncbi:MAG TPA: pilus assembly PilX N-terminal domain-containing protein [Gemmatimonadaceae bacterium]|nr:pilus assembly PilX N-terminal domain-containing protein [Gemmatimonadaceae bacterium]
MGPGHRTLIGGRGAHGRTGWRRGFALASALLAIILITAILAALFFAVTEETRTGSAIARRDHALGVAESAVEAGLDHLRARNPDSFAVGAVESHLMDVEGAPAMLYATRLDSSLFWLVAAVGNETDPGAPARRIGVLASSVRDASDSVTIVRVTRRGWSELF